MKTDSVDIRQRNILLVLMLGLLHAGALDLTNAIVLTPPTLSGPERKAVLMLLEEVEKRTHIRWTETTTWPSSNVCVLAVGPRFAPENFAGPYLRQLKQSLSPAPAEGYRLCVKTGEGNPAVFVLGNDARGVLFGVGRLLRELRMERGRIDIADSLELTTAPKY